MTVTIDICDHPLFRRLAKERIQTTTRTYYEMDNGLYTEDIRQAKEFNQDNIKFYKCVHDSRYRVGDREFSVKEPDAFERAIEHSMTMLILIYGLRDVKNV